MHLGSSDRKSVFIWFFVFMTVCLYAGGYLYGDVLSQGGGKPDVVDNQDIPNPHWNQDMCDRCHKGMPSKDKPIVLRYKGDIIKLCNSCHEHISNHAYIHAVGMVPSEDKLSKMPEGFKTALYRGDKKGRLTCIVCHDLLYQCLKEEYWRKKDNMLFLRGAPYVYRTDICYKCHDVKKYAALNPHDQINDEGEILTARCGVCHVGVPDVKKVRGIEGVRFKVEKDLKRLCTRCHKNVPEHPATSIGFGFLEFAEKDKGKKFTHLREPTPEVSERLRKTTAERDIVMPLEPGTGRIFCATCHNPHERGIQSLSRADKGADNEQRLRASKRNTLCLMCHNK